MSDGEDSWAFALALYAKPGVADACLRLQSAAGVDVMMMLVAIFAAARRRIVLTPRDIAEMDDACRPWRSAIVQPLRAMRTALKTGPRPAPSAASEQLRAQIKASELAAERLENDLLTGWLTSRQADQRADRQDAIAAVISDVVRFALGPSRQSEFAALAPDIAVLTQAAQGRRA